MSDPIVDEVRKARGKLFDECEGSLAKYFERLREGEKDNRERLVDVDEVKKRKTRRQKKAI